MLGYVQKLQFRHQTFVKLLGQDVAIELFNTFEKKDQPAPEPSLFPLNDAGPALTSLGAFPASPQAGARSSVQWVSLSIGECGWADNCMVSRVK